MGRAHPMRLTGRGAWASAAPPSRTPPAPRGAHPTACGEACGWASQPRTAGGGRTRLTSTRVEKGPWLSWSRQRGDHPGASGKGHGRARPRRAPRGAPRKARRGGADVPGSPERVAGGRKWAAVALVREFTRARDHEDMADPDMHERLSRARRVGHRPVVDRDSIEGSRQRLQRNVERPTRARWRAPYSAGRDHRSGLIRARRLRLHDG